MHERYLDLCWVCLIGRRSAESATFCADRDWERYGKGRFAHSTLVKRPPHQDVGGVIMVCGIDCITIVNGI